MPCNFQARACRLAPLVALCAALGFGLAPEGARAVAAADAAGAAGLRIVKGYAIGGDNPLSAARTGQVLAPYLGVPASAELLRQAQVALESALHERGYTYYRVVVPAQSPGETIMLDVVPTVVNRVIARGAEAEAVRRALPELQEGRSPNTRRLARQLAAAQDAGGRWAVRLRPVPGHDTVDAQVEVEGLPAPWGAAVAWTDDGSRATGRDRLALQAWHADVGERGHQARARYTTSLDEPSRVQEWHLAYRLPVRGWGGAWYATYDDVDAPRSSDPWREDWRPVAAGAPGRWVRVGYVQYLAGPQGRGDRVTVDVSQARLDALDEEGRPTGGRERRSQPATVSYHKSGPWGAGMHLDGYLEVSVNLATGPAADLGAHRSERPAIDSVHWKRLRAGVQWRAEGRRGWAWVARVHGQYSPQALLAAESFALGGASSVRGAEERACLGDSGIAGTLEAHSPSAGGWRALAFVDAGRLWNHRGDANRPPRDRLASVGIGVRYQHPSGARLVADYGRVVTGSFSDAAQAADKGDDKLHVSLSYSF